MTALTRIQRVLYIGTFPIRLALAQDRTGYPSRFAAVVIVASVVLLDQCRLRDIRDGKSGSPGYTSREEGLPLVDRKIMQVLEIIDVVRQIGNDVVELTGIPLSVRRIRLVLVLGRGRGGVGRVAVV